mgnify:FL=1
MSGKFMRVKRFIIPTLTAVIIASQLMGCAAMTQSELLQAINNGDQIEIEVIEPGFVEDEQGQETALSWTELASLTTNADLRSGWDDTLGIIRTDEGKNGVFYVNEAGDNENNNTLKVVMHNRAFVQSLESEDSLTALADASLKNYADIEDNETMKAVYMGINGYFNLLPDNEPNYANPDSSLMRNEFMAMVYRADTPVQEITADENFATAVGQSDYNIYAQGVNDNAYLSTEDKNLDNLTYNGAISRAEAIYLIVNRYFSEDFNSFDLNSSKSSLTDAKDGGDIATKQKFIENDKMKDRWRAYELQYAIQNPDDGLPTDLYKALVVANQKGLISSTTRWDEAITRSEAVELLVTALQQDATMETFNYKLGNYDSGMDTTAESTGTVEESTDSTSSIDSTGVDSKIDAGDYIDPTPAQTENVTPAEGVATAEEVLATVPKSVYKPGDTSLTLDEQKEKAKDALHNGTITDRQYAVISEDIRERKEAASSSTTTTGSTGSSTSGDTYIPAHGNPGTPDTGEMLGYEGSLDDAPDSSHVTIN